MRRTDFYGMVELILHIGMGKTGTTSIQRVLDMSAAQLSLKSTEYLGMWFGLIDPRFEGPLGHDSFARAPAEEMRRHAETFAARLAERSAASGARRFIISNESIFGLTEQGCALHADQFAPFVEALREYMQVRIVVYVRDPHDWLPSAYNQWGIYHKAMAGPIRPYGVLGRELIGSYAGLLRWHRYHPDILQVRRFCKTRNVVEDFASVIDVALEAPEGRELERVSVPESIIRHVYNGRYEQDMLPDRFDAAMGGARLSAAPLIGDLMSESFSYRETSEIVSENEEIFSSIRSEMGLDLVQEASPPPSPPDEAVLRDRVVEQLIYVVVEQADRITALEQADRITALEQADRITALEQADRITALEQADRITALEQADRIMALEQADRITALEKALTELPGQHSVPYLQRLRAWVARRLYRD